MHNRVAFEPSNTGIEVVFNTVFSPPMHHLAYAAPTGLVSLNKRIDEHLFLSAPISFFDIRIQNIYPPFSALFSASTFDKLRTFGPLLWAI